MIYDRCSLIGTRNVIINRDSSTLAISSGPVGFLAGKVVMEMCFTTGGKSCIRGGQCHVDAK